MIIEMERVGEVVVQQVLKPDGSLVRIQYGKPGEADSFKQVSSVEEARKELAPLVGKTVDRNGAVLIQKISKNGEAAGYRHGNAAVGWTSVSTLAEARKAIGKVVAK